MKSSSLVPITTTAAVLALIVLFPSLPALASSCPAPDFVSFHTFETGFYPASVALGDFNGDGTADLAVAIYQGVSVLLGFGDGTFEAAVHYRTGSVGSTPEARSVAVADFNADGKSDLAVANSGSGDVSVLLGNGDGTFQAAVNCGAGISPEAVAIGDFNGDGKPDLAVANDYTTDNLRVLLGNGDGTLQTNVTLSLDGWPTSLAAGDFNGDGKLDLAVGRAGDSGLEVLIGRGDGTFHAAVHYRTGSWARSVAVGDLNGDGISDLTVANHSSDDVSVLLGKGDGTFNPAVNYDTGDSPSSVAVGDFNRDGHPDLVVVNQFSDDISVLLNKGDGNFQAAVHFCTGSARSAAVGDFNADGKLDLAAAIGLAAHISVLLGTGDGTFQAGPVHRAGGNPTDVAVEDLNADGVPDLVAAAFDTDTDGVERTAYISVLLGNGDGSFQAAVRYRTGLEGPRELDVADFNGNGQPDVAMVDGGGVAVLLGEGGVAFQPAVRYSAGNEPHSLAVGDFNGDRAIDLAVANRGQSTNGSVSILPGRGDGTFGSAVRHALNTSVVAVAAGDFNGDGKLDLVVANAALSGSGDIFSPNLPTAPSSLCVLLGRGDGTFQPGLRYEPGGDLIFLRTGDLNGDGILDLVVVDPGIPGRLGNVAVMLGSGDGTFQPAVHHAGEGRPQSVVITDFNSDGASDLIVSYLTSFSIHFGRGDGTFQHAIRFTVGSWADSAVVADFNQDGQLDVAVPSFESGIVMLLNRCTNIGMKLDVTRINNAITLNWPLSYTHFVLESATNFSSTNWQGFSGAVKTNNGRMEVSVPLDQGQCYFRLRGQ